MEEINKTPKQIVAALDNYVIGQNQLKKRWRSRYVIVIGGWNFLLKCRKKLPPKIC